MHGQVADEENFPPVFFSFILEYFVIRIFFPPFFFRFSVQVIIAHYTQLNNSDAWQLLVKRMWLIMHPGFAFASKSVHFS